LDRKTRDGPDHGFDVFDLDGFDDCSR